MITILDSTKIQSNKTCIALGNFDGVHSGHRSIISAAVNRAKYYNKLSCVYTFQDHTSELLGIEKKLLTDTEEKNRIFDTLGCDIAYLDDFESVRHMSPHEFCKNVLKERLNAEFVFCGENYRFGYLGKGDTSVLNHELFALGINLEVIPFVYTLENKIVSSTIIRNLISNGNVKEAHKLMTIPYRISGVVMHGKQLGRKLGFPTLNITIPYYKVIPKFGVYVSACLLDGIWYKGISNIGIRPTTDFNTNAKDIVNCETFLFDYSGDAYNKRITVLFFDMLRPEMKFDSVDKLKKQIKTDTLEAKSLFNVIKPEFK